MSGKKLVQRKPYRLKEFDYASCGSYFITICTQNRREWLWEEGKLPDETGDCPLSEYGRIVQQAILGIPKHYPAVGLDRYVIMPNHVHLLLTIQCDADGRAMRAPTIATVVNQMKGYASKCAGISLWQKLYYDHIVRNETDYREIWQYIEENPRRWEEDSLRQL